MDARPAVNENPDLIEHAFSRLSFPSGAWERAFPRSCASPCNALPKPVSRLPAFTSAMRAVRGSRICGNFSRPCNRTESRHFVVIAGKDDFDHPGAGAAKRLYPLREYGSKVEALRFYGKLRVSPSFRPAIRSCRCSRQPIQPSKPSATMRADGSGTAISPRPPGRKDGVPKNPVPFPL